MIIRSARNDDTPILTEIVRTSNAYAGEYRRMVKHITITPEQIARDTAFVAEVDGQVAGFYSLKAHHSEIELDFLFVDNAFVGTGIGRVLFTHMLVEAERLGYTSVIIVVHPPAEAFYQKMGAVKIGVVPPRDHITWERTKMQVTLGG